MFISNCHGVISLDLPWIYGADMKSQLNRELLKSPKVLPQMKPFQIHDTKQSGFILRIQPTGVMTYYYEYRLKGKRNRVRIGTTKEINPVIARDLAEDFAHDVKKEINPAVARREARVGTMTLGDYVTNEYSRWALSRFRSGAATINQIESVFKHLLKKPLNDQSFSTYIEDHQTARLESGIKKATIDREVGALKSLFSHAVKNEKIKLPIHPLRNVTQVRKENNDDEGDERDRYLGQQDPNEPTNFWKAIEAREVRKRNERRHFNEWRRIRHLPPLPDLDQHSFADHLKPMIVLSLNTGLRRRELFCSTWEKFKPNLPQPTLTIPGAIAKNKKTRHIVLNRTALQTLLLWQRQTGRASGLIFPSHNGKPRSNVKKAWGKLLADAKIENFRWHDMRHDFASRLVMAGVDLTHVRSLLGHSSFKLTLRYAHLAPKNLHDAVLKLDASSRS